MRTRIYGFALIAIVIIGMLVQKFAPPPHASLVTYILVLATCLLVISALVTRAGDPLDVETRIPEGEYEPRSYYLSDGGKKKHPQMILALTAEFFDYCVHFRNNVNVLVYSDFMSWPETASCLVLRERQVLEPDESYRQLLPYVVVRQIGADGVMRYFAYQRTKQVGEQRLAGKCSIGLGGHIDATSVVFREDSTVDLLATVVGSAWRELSEELAVWDEKGQSTRVTDINASLQFANLFITHNEDVQRMHLGIVMYFDVPAGVKVDTAEDELEPLGWFDEKELQRWFREKKTNMELEVWSQLLADRYAGLLEEVGHVPV